MGTASTEAGEKSVFYGGKEYATLDFTPPRTGEVGTQREFLEVPEGWVLAEKSEGVVEELIGKFPWGANVVVLSNGDSHLTSKRVVPGQISRSDCLEKRGEHAYRPKYGNSRLLIVRAEVHEPAADGDQCAQALTRIWQSREFADCEVVCNGHTFQCHRVVLAQASPVFKQMLSGEMLEAKTQRIRLEALESETEAASEFLAFVYTGKLDCKSKHFPTVVKLADFYQLDCITAKTCDNMLRAADVDNVVPISRFFKSMREKPRVAPYWTKLGDRVQKSKELTFALMSGV